jgi:hypothetical protein
VGRTKSESESYVTTVGQPASLSWNKAPFWGLRPDLYYCLTVAGLLIWGALSDRVRVCRLLLLLVLAIAVIFGSVSRRTRGNILLSQIRDFPFRRLLRLAGSRWRYSTPPPHGLEGRTNHLLPFNTTATVQKTTPLTITRRRGNVFTEFLPNNDRVIHRHIQTLL